jgi:hypothetical protein
VGKLATDALQGLASKRLSGSKCLLSDPTASKAVVRQWNHFGDSVDGRVILERILKI